MDYGRKYPFPDLWKTASGAKEINELECKKCKNRMLYHKLINVETDYGKVVGLIEFDEVWLTTKGSEIKEDKGWVKYLDNQRPSKTGHYIAIAVELIIGGGLLWFAYRTDVRADRLDKEETKYKTSEQKVEILEKQNRHLLNKTDSLSKEIEMMRKQNTKKKNLNFKFIP